MFHLNIQGLCSSFDELKRIVSDGTPDVIGLCETPGFKKGYSSIYSRI